MCSKQHEIRDKDWHCLLSQPLFEVKLLWGFGYIVQEGVCGTQPHCTAVKHKGIIYTLLGRGRQAAARQ